MVRIEAAVLLEAIDIANPARHANSRRVVRADLGRVGDDDVDLHDAAPGSALLASSPGTRSQQCGRVSD
ncbi:hypothetical protein ED92_14100 [Amycolatopsis sp. MJM2582]|nr:hypothetical protein ED92_14100 [Amycolatopsis sp. MJM2582]